jgi:hypothetical protein
MRMLQSLRVIACATVGCVIFLGGNRINAQDVAVVREAKASLPDAPGSVLEDGRGARQSQESGLIRGTVLGPNGAAVDGAHITLSQERPGGTGSREAISGSNGGFKFGDVAPGGFKLTITLPGYATRNFSGVLKPGEDLSVGEQNLSIAATANDVQVTVSREEAAEYEVKAEEQQRVLGFLPNFYVSYVSNPVPLSSKQKFELAWKTVIDPVTFGLTGVVAGVEQATNTFPGYGQGAAGYGKRYGAAYGDGLFGTFIGSAILPSVLKQDPRYFYKGTGTVRSRALYAIANSVICKGDNGHWQPDYSAILGGLAAAGISNLYYPASSRNGAALTFENAAIGTAVSAAANLLQEFVIRRLTPKARQNAPGTP